MRAATIVATLLELASAQHAGKAAQEVHLPVKSEFCSKSAGGCVTEDTTIVLDQNWRWVHDVGGYTNCYHNMEWDPKFCPDPLTCAKNCAVEGVDEAGMKANYGVSLVEGGIQASFEVLGGNVGSRVYLMENETSYKMFNLKNKEFSFDVELATLPCGINAALYFVEMEQDGGAASSGGLNSAGAKYGTGYCDAQCPGDVKFVGGKGNVNVTAPMRPCCAEMDIWESNNVAAAVTPHPCSIPKGGQKLCEHAPEGDKCFCDHDGCDFNSYREGVTDFYGPGSEFTVDTTKPFTIVTQFITDDGTDDGKLSEIRRFYVQDGKKIPNSKNKDLGHDSLTDDSCKAQKDLFGEPNDFENRGGMAAMGDAFERGMVLVMSIWDDSAVNMLWLDSTYPVNATGPGAARGPCATDTGVPEQVRHDNPNAYVKYMNIRSGDIGATYPPLPPAPTPPPPPAPPAPEYTEYDGKNCYNGHGGAEIDGYWSGLTKEQCMDHCNGNEACNCATFAPNNGACWLRSSCNPEGFESNGGYSVYVKSPASAFTLVV